MKPRGYTIKRQSQTISPQTGVSAIMDDSVYTMDDSRVMMGGQVTIYQDIRVKAKTPASRAIIRKRR